MKFPLKVNSCCFRSTGDGSANCLVRYGDEAPRDTFVSSADHLVFRGNILRRDAGRTGNKESNAP